MARAYPGYARDINNGSAFHVRESILNSQESTTEQQGNRFIEAFDGRSGDWSAFAAHSCVVYHAIEPPEPFYDKIHQCFGVGRARSVCPFIRHIWAKFVF